MRSLRRVFGFIRHFPERRGELNHLPLIAAFHAVRRSEKRAALVGWLVSEMVARVFLPRSRSCNTVLLSYPRSGNHLVRYVVEYCSSQPTLGDRDHESLLVARKPLDGPIHLRTADVRVKTRSPILVKRHRLDLEPDLLILLVRHPIEAIISNLGRGKDSIDRDQLIASAEQYLAHCANYQEQPESRRLLIRYDNLQSDPIAEFSRLLSFLGISGFAEELEYVCADLDKAKAVLQRESRPDLVAEFKKKFSGERKVLSDYLLAREGELQALGLTFDLSVMDTESPA